MNSLLKAYFPSLDSRQLIKFNDLYAIYSGWNDKINVISRKDIIEFETRHVLHSLSIAKFIQFKKGSEVMDFGTGGGFPGIPLAIFFPDVNFVLIDSVEKKMKVVRSVCETMKLQNVRTFTGRVEELRMKFDFVTCRAVGRMNKILPWVSKSIKKENNNDLPNGFLFLKGGNLMEELSEIVGSYQRITIGNYFAEPFFEAKEIVYLPNKL